MKQKLIEIINADTSYNKNATRSLKRTHPELWQELLNATNFLPDDAKPKQRVWHVLNDKYERPVCPITGEYVKWWENRYLETVNRSAKTTLMNTSGKFNNQTEETKIKRKNTLKEGFKSGRLQHKKRTKEEIKTITEKIKETNIKKYGVHSTLMLKEVREKQYQTKVKKGLITPRELRSNRDLYYAEVKKFTEKSWLVHFNKINPKRLNRSVYTLDHIYSVQMGFRNNIPPYIIGHWTNLQMLEGSINSSKGLDCWKEESKLFEDFFKNYKIS
jgi:hypothetical protein